MKISYFSTATGSAVDLDAGVLRGVSVITEGEAKGHQLQIDATTLQQVKACAETYADGLRVKMDHFTGIDAMVGVLKNFAIDGPQLRADMYLLKSHADFAKIMEMAATMPGAFGLSIAFSGKPEAIGEGTHFARCTEIYSCDIVDIPAANPSGLFSNPMKTAPEITPEDEALATVTITVTTPEDAAEQEAEETPADEAAESPAEQAQEVADGTEQPIAEMPDAETPAEDATEDPAAEDDEAKKTKAPALDAIVADVATFAAAQTALSAELATVRVELAAKDAALTALTHKLADQTTELAAARADLAAYDAKHAQLSSLHGQLKKSLGLMPATNIPDAAVIDQARTPEDFRREYAAIQDPTQRAEFFARNESQMFGI